ncbi:MAG: hypothetical protein SV583_11695 [Pseudomonadota bacterium]|nr:hypothetical protein [Pseudomonadota bacterium]
MAGDKAGEGLELDDWEGDEEGAETDGGATDSGGDAAPYFLSSREKLRQQMAADVESFLARGGTIQVIERGMALPPKPRAELAGEGL